MNIPRIRADLDALITGKVEEGRTLEYKAAESLGRSNERKVEITKDVSAFANAAGGVLIYGIGEQPRPNDHLPQGFDPIDRRVMSKEWLDQIIGQIQPRIDGLEVVPVHVGPGDHDYCYVVGVPQSETAHQALTLRYHKRSNFESPPMEDYEIRDVMNRRKHPRIVATARVANRMLMVRLQNVGLVMANHYQVTVEFPTCVQGEPVLLGDPQEPVLKNDDAGSRWLTRLYEPTRPPLFPGATETFRLRYFGATLRPVQEMRPSINHIGLKVYADNMDRLVLEKDLTAALAAWT